MARKAIFGTALTVLLIALVIPALAAGDLMPFAAGDKWEYDSVKLVRATITREGQTLASMNDASSGSSVYEVFGADTKAGTPVYDYRETTTLTSTNGASDTDKVELKVASDADGMRILSSYTDPAGGKPDKQTYDPSLLYFDKKCAAGKSWDVGVMRDGDMKSPTSARGVSKETVTVLAGTFKDCLKVVYSSDNISGTMEIWGKTFSLTSGRTRGVYWMAEGIGVVKELEVSSSTAQADGPDGKPVIIESATCVVSELRPGFIVK